MTQIIEHKQNIVIENTKHFIQILTLPHCYNGGNRVIHFILSAIRNEMTMYNNNEINRQKEKKMKNNHS